MKTLLKTKDVSRVLSVNPTTIQRWVKYFELPCEKNEHGHYLFDDTNILQLKEIKQQLSIGLPMSQVQITHLNQTESFEQTKLDHVLLKFDQMAERLDYVESQLEEKATNVVNIQLLQHRRELEKLHNLVENLKAEINELKTTEGQNEVISTTVKERQKSPRNWLASLLSL